jgi:alginate O-acetyltransferase complex protein AlgI
MAFNSFLFIFLFLPLTIVIYFLLVKRYSDSKYWLLISISTLFYSWPALNSPYSWPNLHSLVFLFGSIMFNYFLGRSLLTYSNKKRLICLGLGANIFSLCYFKYSNAIIQNINSLMKLDVANLSTIALPVAISFITFQQISFLVDIYRGDIKKINLLEYVTYITYFPRIISGPITRYNELVRELNSSARAFFNSDNAMRGTLFFITGLFKKIIIADTLSRWVSSGFDQTQNLTFIGAWISSLSYTLQIYFDFSGYTDMAIGISLMLNIKLPINFDSPYISTNIQEFWRRWHITLSYFLRDYIYFPLGGSKISARRTVMNIMITFLICGLWHGAGWNFVFWGTMHGAALVVYRLWSISGHKLNKLLAWFITFNFINVAWVFFRAASIDSAINILKAMIDIKSFPIYQLFSENSISLKQLLAANTNFGLPTVIFLVSALTLALFPKNSNQIIQDLRIKPIHAFVAGLMFAVSIVFLKRGSEFLYFNF